MGLMQSTSRLVRMQTSKSLPRQWERASLYMRISHPPGKLEFDHWDREGSVGLYVGAKQEKKKRGGHNDASTARGKEIVQRELVAVSPHSRSRTEFVFGLLCALDVVVMLMAVLGSVVIVSGRLPFSCCDGRPALTWRPLRRSALGPMD